MTQNHNNNKKKLAPKLQEPQERLCRRCSAGVVGHRDRRRRSLFKYFKDSAPKHLGPLMRLCRRWSAGVFGLRVRRHSDGFNCSKVEWG